MASSVPGVAAQQLVVALARGLDHAAAQVDHGGEVDVAAVQDGAGVNVAQNWGCALGVSGFGEECVGTFRCVDATQFNPGQLPYKKLDNDEISVKFDDHQYPVENIRGREADFPLDKTGFGYHHAPTDFTEFDSNAAIRERYYRDVEAKMVHLIPGAKRAIVFAHVVRHRMENRPGGDRPWDQARQPTSELHVDNDGPTVQRLVRAALTEAEADEAVKGRFGLINMWRPINHPASDHPLATADWRTTRPEDFATMRLLLPYAQSKTLQKGVFDMSHLDEQEPLPKDYDAIGLGLMVKPSPELKFYYVKDMTPDEVLLIKCYDSFGEGQPLGERGISALTPHAAFDDPLTPAGSPGRQSIEARCLIFW
ncbi:hypothetical protein PspLS_03348 [Pyricularia sp. CBS 133598]|nr:hypothetical protein PspLS_03348 [Pyricularia sp. CBS 133598]